MDPAQPQRPQRPLPAARLAAEFARLRVAAGLPDRSGIMSQDPPPLPLTVRLRELLADGSARTRAQRPEGSRVGFWLRPVRGTNAGIL